MEKRGCRDNTDRAPTAPTVEQEGFYHFMGYSIPIRLLKMTGGGPETWDGISAEHLKEYERYCPINEDHAVLEIGCGVGRDAIPLTQVLNGRGRYIGIDIIEDSIQWCKDNITRRHPNFSFYHYPVKSPIHNPSGTISATSVRLPLPNKTVDRIIVQSVFTHIFEPDVRHYLREFRRLLKDDGLVFASFFIVDDQILKHVRAANTHLSFAFDYGDQCYIDNKEWPEGAVAYTEEKARAMVRDTGLSLVQPIHRGLWSGCFKDGMDGQDILILGRDKLTWKAMVRRLYSR
jgi:ubiquinone/menaquinone biosynthesis C-methylase UbiE